VPPLAEFAQLYPEVKISLQLEDRIVDLIDEQIDVAIRTSNLVDSTLVARKLAENRSVIVASPPSGPRRRAADAGGFARACLPAVCERWPRVRRVDFRWQGWRVRGARRRPAANQRWRLAGRRGGGGSRHPARTAGVGAQGAGGRFTGAGAGALLAARSGDLCGVSGPRIPGLEDVGVYRLPKDRMGRFTDPGSASAT
jgi:DNA-binding transcriptional LysR family regulator